MKTRNENGRLCFLVVGAIDGVGGDPQVVGASSSEEGSRPEAAQEAGWHLGLVSCLPAVVKVLPRDTCILPGVLGGGESKTQQKSLIIWNLKQKLPLYKQGILE